MRTTDSARAVVLGSLWRVPDGPFRPSRRATRTVTLTLEDDPGHDHGHDHGHGHSHGLIDESIKRSREGVRAVSLSLAVLGVAAAVQTVIFVLSGSVALLADLIHNFGDALTAVPLGACVPRALGCAPSGSRGSPSSRRSSSAHASRQSRPCSG